MDLIKFASLLWCMYSLAKFAYKLYKTKTLVNGWERPQTSVLHIIAAENALVSLKYRVLLKTLEERVRKYMNESFDHSHDYSHILRVVRQAIRIAHDENFDNHVAVIIVAMLHDYGDRKAKVRLEGEPSVLIRTLLQELECDEEILNHIVEAATSIGFGKEAEVVRRGFQSETSRWLWRIVSDADRLDSIGPIGWARAFAFGGSKDRPLYETEAQDDSKDGYNQRALQGTGSTLGHFHEKLKTIQSTLKTKSGVARSRSLHDQLVEFYIGAVDQIHGRFGQKRTLSDVADWIFS